MDGQIDRHMERKKDRQSISCNLFHYARNNTFTLKKAEYQGCVIQIYEERQELLHFLEQQPTFIMQQGYEEIYVQSYSKNSFIEREREHTSKLTLRLISLQ